MIFGLDFDGTVTGDLTLFTLFVMNAKKRGHKVYLVTMRYESERYIGGHPIPDSFAELTDGVFFTGRKAKGPFMQAKGIDVDVWLDDNPQAVYMGADEIWPDPSPEGNPITPMYE